MSKKKGIILGLSVIIIVAAIIGHSWLRQNSTAYNLFFPPDDLYAHLATSPLEKYTGNHNFLVQHKYPGQYEIVLWTSSTPKIGDKYITDFIVEVSVAIKKVFIINTKVSKPFSQFWGNQNGGMVLFAYRVPEDIPKHEPAYIKTNISGDKYDFIDKYGDTNIIIRKRADK